MKRGPSHVLVVIIFHRVIFLFDCIHKKIPSGLDLKYSRLLYGIFLPVCFPPMFDMGENLKDNKCDLFSVEKIVNIEISF
jgi:hypothetical protein